MTMSIQDIVTYLIVGVAVLYAAKTVTSQFLLHDEPGCGKCSSCPSAKTSTPPHQDGTLIQIDEGLRD